MKKFLLLTTALLFSAAASADFSGAYDLSNWSVTAAGPSAPVEVDFEATVDTDDAPFSLTIVSPDCPDVAQCSAPAYEFAFTIEVAADAYLSFDWFYASDDVGGPLATRQGLYDRLGVWKNGQFYQLMDSSGDALQSGSGGINVLAGDIFGFGLRSGDSTGGLSLSEISNFQVSAYGSGVDGPFYPEIPLPGAVWLFVSALVGLVTIKRK